MSSRDLEWKRKMDRRIKRDEHKKKMRLYKELKKVTLQINEIRERRGLPRLRNLIKSKSGRYLSFNKASFNKWLVLYNFRRTLLSQYMASEKFRLYYRSKTTHEKIQHALEFARVMFDLNSNLSGFDPEKSPTLNKRIEIVRNFLTNIVDELENEGKYIKIKLTTDEGGKIIYTLSTPTVDDIIRILTKGISVTGDEISDSDKIKEFYTVSFTKLEVSIIEKKTKTDQDVHFFNKINTSPFDLTRYQIITSKEELPIIKEHCFIHGLRLAGVENELLNEIKLRIKNNYLKISEYKNIAHLIKRQIINHKYLGTAQKLRKTYYGKEYEEVIELGTYNNHSFILEPVEITRFIARNWQKVLDREPNEKVMSKFNSINKIRKNGYEYTKKFTMNSLTLIKQLDESGAFENSPIFAKSHEILKDYDEQTYVPFLVDVEKDCEPVVEPEQIFFDDDLTIFTKFREVFFADCESTTEGRKHKLMAVKIKNDKKTKEYAVKTRRPDDRKYRLFEKVLKYIIYHNKENDHDSAWKKLKALRKEIGELGKSLEGVTDEQKIISIKTDLKGLWSQRKPLEKFIKENGKPSNSFLIYFHNLKYDKSFFKRRFAVSGCVEKDNILYEMTVEYGGFKFVFRDSYKLIPAPISKFDEMFGLEIEKDVLPYDLYTSITIYQDNIKVEKALEHLKGSDHEQFLKNLEEHNFYCEDKEYFRHMDYMMYYLDLDVEVLIDGFMKQRETFHSITGYDIYNYLTIPSITFAYLKKARSFDGICQLGGQTRCFVQKSIKGGRVATKENKKWLIDGKKHGNIVDFDACSLYPSAIVRVCEEMGGFPTGVCHVLEEEQLNKEELDKLIYYTVEIKITEINKKLPISFISDKVKQEKYRMKENKKGIMKNTRIETVNTVYSNEVPENNLVVDKITLEDWIKFHDIKYEIIRGVYWDEDVNPIFGERIEELYNKRKEYKKQKNMAMSSCLKLIMNSSYGKTIQKASTDRTKYMFNQTEKQQSKIDEYICKNYNRILPSKEYDQYTEIKELISFVNHQNCAHIGGLILSMSKRIMNEVMALAFDNGIEIFYQDTDSMHMFQRDVDRLGELYEDQYGKVLIGGNLGQFHSDFEMDDAVDEVVSTYCVILGKKAYLDVLEAHDKDGKVITDYHIRLKGVNKAGLEKAEKDFGSYEALYKELYDREEGDKPITFDLCADKFRPKFTYTKMGEVYTETDFTRDVRFEYPKGNLC